MEDRVDAVPRLSWHAMCCSVMYGMWGENMQMKQSGGISTVYEVAGRCRHRRCSSAIRVSLVTFERKDSGRKNSCRRCVKILLRRIGERGSNYFANYHLKQCIALECL